MKYNNEFLESIFLNKSEDNKEKLLSIFEIVDKIHDIEYSMEYGFNKPTSLHRLKDYNHTVNLNKIFVEYASRYRDEVSEFINKIKTLTFKFDESYDIHRSYEEIKKMDELCSSSSILLPDCNSFLNPEYIRSEYNKLSKILDEGHKVYSEEAEKELGILKDELEYIISDKVKIKEIKSDYISNIAELLGMEFQKEGPWKEWYMKTSSKGLTVAIRRFKEDNGFDLIVFKNPRSYLIKLFNIPEVYAYTGLYEFISKVFKIGIFDESSLRLLIEGYGFSKFENYLSKK